MKCIIKIISLLFIVFISIGNCHHRSMEHKAEKIVKKLTSELSLDDKQKSELQRIKKEVLDKNKELNIKRIPEGFADQIRQAQIDEASINKAFEANEAKRDQLRIFTVKKFVEFHTILTPEQRNKLADRVNKILSKRKHD